MAFDPLPSFFENYFILYFLLHIFFSASITLSGDKVFMERELKGRFRDSTSFFIFSSLCLSHSLGTSLSFSAYLPVSLSLCLPGAE